LKKWSLLDKAVPCITHTQLVPVGPSTSSFLDRILFQKYTLGRVWCFLGKGERNAPQDFTKGPWMDPSNTEYGRGRRNAALFAEMAAMDVEG
jgi:hypothetical protein